MALQVTNRLNGIVDQQVSDTSLADSAGLGTVTVAAPGPRAIYSTATTVYSLPTVEERTGHHRGNTPAMRFAVPSGSWSVRFYIQLPDLSASGNGAHEVRWVLKAGNMGLVLHESSNGNVSARLQSTNLDASDITPSFSGTAISVAELTRIELSTDGVSTTVRFYRLHDNTDPYVIAWSNLALDTGVTAELTGYRYWRNHFMAYGNTSFSQDVANYQQFLMDLGYPAPQFGADGFYGDEMASQWDGYAADIGLSELVGTFGPGGSAGAEILAAVDLSIDELNATATPPPVYLSHLAVGEGEWIGPAPEPVQEGDGEPLSVEFDLQADGYPVFHGDGEPLEAEFDLTSSDSVTGNGQPLAVEFDMVGDGNQLFEGDGEPLSVEFDLSSEGMPVFHGDGQPLGVEFDLDSVTDMVSGDGTLPVEFGLTDTATVSGDSEDLGVEFDLQSTGHKVVLLPDVPLVGLRYRLIAYEPDGERRGQLPYPLSFNLGVPHNDMPSLRLDYLKDAPGADLLSTPCEVAVELAAADSLNYVEYPGCRFLNLREREDITDRMGVVSYTMPNYGWMLRKVRNINNDAFNEEGERAFSGATVGEIMHTFLSEAQTRGNIPGLVWDFTTTHDSAGTPWDTAYNLSFAAGQDLWSTLDAFAQQGALDWRMHGRTLQLYVLDTELNRDLTDDVILRLHRDITEAPNDSTAEELASSIFVQGEGAHATITSSGAMQPWGAWEDYISQSGVSDTGTLITLAQWRLERTRALRRQMTRGLLFSTTEYLPFLHYLPGDRVTAPGVFSDTDPLRVRQVTLSSLDVQGMEGNVILNDRFLERELRRDKQLHSLTGGASGSTGGVGGRPGEDTRTPKTPTSLLLSTQTYLNEVGEPRGQITAGWEPVTEATNNTEMNVDEYEVWVRRAVSGETFAYFTSVDDPDTTAYMSGFDVGQVYEVRVRALASNNRYSAWSQTNSILVEPDAIAPPTPSDQVLTADLGTANVAWDGLTWDGLGMPLDFSHVRVWMSDSSTGPFTRINTLYREGSVVVPNLVYDTPYWFYLTAVDRSGNESDPSTMTSIEVQELVPNDFFGPGSIGYELLAEGAVRDDILADDAVRNRHIAAGEITGGKIRSYSITADRIAVGNTKNLITDPRLDDVDLFTTRKTLSEAESGGNWGRIDDVNGQARLILISRSVSANGTYEFFYAQNVGAQSLLDPSAGIMVDGDLGRVVARFLLYIEGLTAGNVYVSGEVRFLKKDGTIHSTLSAVARQSFTGGVNDYEMVSNTGASIPAEAYSMIFSVRVELVATPDTTNVWIRSPFAATSNGTVLIEDGAVIADKIAANAITADKIDVGAIEARHIKSDAIQTEELAADAINVKHTITGAVVQTDAADNVGLKINIAGLWGFDEHGNRTLNFDARDGKVTTTGRFQTGVNAGNSVVVDADLYSGRPAIQLSTGSFHDLQPVMYSMGLGSTDYPDGALLIHGRENIVNDTGRNSVQLNSGNGEGGSLSQEYGSYGGVGFHYEDWSLHLRGRLDGSHHTMDYQIVMRSSESSGSDPLVQWTMPYGSTPPSGGRMVMASGYGQNTSFRSAPATVINNYAASCVVMADMTRWDSGETCRIQLLATWTASHWSSQ